MAYTKTEILKAFLNQDETVIPVSFWHHFTKSEFIDALAHPEVPDINVRGHHHYVETVQPDFVKSMSDGYFVTPSLHGYGPKTIGDLQTVTPLAPTAPWLTQQAALVRRQRRAVGDRLLFYTVFSPVTLLKWSLFNHDTESLTVGDRRFTELYLQDPVSVKAALFRIGQDVKNQVQQVIAAGADGIYYSTQSIQDPRLKTRAFFEALVEPVDLDVIAQINQESAVNILHICGFDGATNDLTWYKDYPLQVINWATHVDHLSLAAGKKLFGNKPVLGGFGDRTNDILYAGTKEQIQAEAVRLVETAGRQGVIIGADCTVPRDTPVEHLKWAADAVHALTISRQRAAGE